MPPLGLPAIVDLTSNSQSNVEEMITSMFMYIKRDVRFPNNDENESAYILSS